MKISQILLIKEWVPLKRKAFKENLKLQGEGEQNQYPPKKIMKHIVEI